MIFFSEVQFLCLSCTQLVPQITSDQSRRKYGQASIAEALSAQQFVDNSIHIINAIAIHFPPCIDFSFLFTLLSQLCEVRTLLYYWLSLSLSLSLSLNHNGQSPKLRGALSVVHEPVV